MPDIQAGRYHNTAKITQKERGGSKSDDDWVLTDEDAPDEIRFNLVKMTSASGWPKPLDGTTFKLYRSNTVLSGFAGVDYTADINPEVAID